MLPRLTLECIKQTLILNQEGAFGSSCQGLLGRGNRLMRGSAILTGKTLLGVSIELIIMVVLHSVRTRTVQELMEKMA